MAGEDRSTIGSRIKEARRTAGLTQRELAEALDVTVRSIQNYESGATVPYRYLREIEALTGKRRGWILDGDEGDQVVARLNELKALIHDHRNALQQHLSELREESRLRQQAARSRTDTSRRGPGTVEG